MSRPAGALSGDLLYTNADRAGIDERWSQPSSSQRRKLLSKFGSSLGRKHHRKHTHPAGDHSPGTTEPASPGVDYLDYEQDLPINEFNYGQLAEIPSFNILFYAGVLRYMSQQARVEKPLCEVCHSHGHHPPHPKTLLEDMLKCRICGNSYHLRCLRAAGLPNQPRGALLDRHSWSCMKCVSVPSTLSHGPRLTGLRYPSNDDCNDTSILIHRCSGNVPKSTYATAVAKMYTSQN
ncbi:hypothetical protein HPB51_008874 [Rhipicephalus microplus]|uniref:PHD-type domain-containing protein n=1 Tax=Rhipicephalus microplus TaxID=6941 RepID=A0A9J6ENR3_RHIMP|nr:hypothetical protein HPB51_008874 [Rhipicephalus microplus]